MGHGTFSSSETQPSYCTHRTHSNSNGDIAELLERRNELTEAISRDPHCINLYSQRSAVYYSLGYADLAAMDDYKAILLIDDVLNEFGESHGEAVASLQNYISLRPDSWSERLACATANPRIRQRLDSRCEYTRVTDVEVQEDEVQLWVREYWWNDTLVRLAFHLSSIGCLRTAYNFIKQANHLHPKSKSANLHLQLILEKAHASFTLRNIPWDLNNNDINNFPDDGLVRREVYPWNYHEGDRTLSKGLKFLNQELSVVAPKLEVRMTELPALSADGTRTSSSYQPAKTIKQLGIFANEDIEPGEAILNERTLLAVNNQHYEPLCDACCNILPDLTTLSKDKNAKQPVPCPDCDDTLFCGFKCLTLAQSSYHPAVCGADDVEVIAKDVPAEEAADALYTRLLLRTFAMSMTQDKHPLDLKEVKYISGDFTPKTSASCCTPDYHPTTLPFTFAGNILNPLHALTRLNLSPFTAPHDLAEAWVYNTLYAKFRGTASARRSPHNGRPEVAAVHPMWSLANHSCDPNVAWEWAGVITYTVREKRVAWRRRRTINGRSEHEDVNGRNSRDLVEMEAGREGGIKKGEEILNHYVDINLPVAERREWGVGPLGGSCMCERCVWEASATDKDERSDATPMTECTNFESSR